ncbi:MAG TPA: hypothetical protein VFB19_14830 [Mycobacterium sp.]|nr:hypothetical protein [Mycobacterium sp.]
MTDVDIRPELTRLTETQRERVRTEIDRRRATCTACGNHEFTVGDALYLGFLFLNQNVGTYMVALTCTNTDCREPRTGIRLDESELFDATDMPKRPSSG